MSKPGSDLTLSKPCQTREETVETLLKVCDSSRPRISNVHGEGPLLVSDIPSKCKDNTDGAILGIDEAGRGPVLGPMTYAAAYWHPSDSKLIPKGFTDSKQLSATTRSKLFSQIQSTPEMGFVLRVLHASEISRNMQRAQPYNLNAMSHDSAMQMIQCVLDAGVKLATCYIDTVGVPESYRAKLERRFEGRDIEFIVEKKCDANYDPCSAASVVAKVSRDTITESWKWTEKDFDPEDNKNYGSGYPSDPTCKSWLQKNFTDPIFCYPDFVRFSWGPAKKAIKEHGVEIQWEAEQDDDDEEVVDRNQTNMNVFFKPIEKRKQSGQGRGSLKKEKRQRLDYFDRMKVNAVGTLFET